MTQRTVSPWDLREILLLWQAGRGVKEIARWAHRDPKTVRRYLARARALGVDRTTALGPDVIAEIDAAAHPPRRKSRPRESLEHLGPAIAHELATGISLRAIHGRLLQAGLAVSYATLHRFARSLD